MMLGFFGVFRRYLRLIAQGTTFPVLGSCFHRIARSLSLVCCWAEPTTMPVFGSLSAFYLFWVGSLLLADVAYVLAAGTSCPTCFGNLAGCSFSSDGRCPARTALEENVKTVAAAAAATTVAAGTVFKLHDLISLRFLRMFTANSLSMVLRLISKPAAGTTFVLDASTKLSAPIYLK